jgi:hypothetical protein
MNGGLRRRGESDCAGGLGGVISARLPTVQSQATVILEIIL